MSLNTFGHLFRVTTWGESHGPALGATVDGCPPGVPVNEAGVLSDTAHSTCSWCIAVIVIVHYRGKGWVRR